MEWVLICRRLIPYPTQIKTHNLSAVWHNITFDIPVSLDLEFVYQPIPGRYTSVADVSKYTKAYFHAQGDLSFIIPWEYKNR